MADMRDHVPRLAHALVAVCRSFLQDLFDPYRPELHYMRGPGPKWRAKHGIAEPCATGAIATPLPASG
jgi:hypothetical protein